MTIDEMITVLQAAKEGKNIQMKHHHGNNPEWKDVESSRLGWDFSCFDYRVKPEPMEIEVWMLENGEYGRYMEFVKPSHEPSHYREWTKKKFREVIE